MAEDTIKPEEEKPVEPEQEASKAEEAPKAPKAAKGVKVPTFTSIAEFRTWYLSLTEDQRKASKKEIDGEYTRLTELGE